jgi:hypothetical protein
MHEMLYGGLHKGILNNIKRLRSKESEDFMFLKPCFDCGKTIDADSYPCYYAKEEDEEICKECYEKRYGKETDPIYI